MSKKKKPIASAKAKSKRTATVELTPDQIKARAKGYTSQYAFMNADREAYNAARRVGILDDVCKPRRYRSWSTASTKDFNTAAAKYKSRADLRKADSGLYQALRKADMWADVVKRNGW